jgi:Alpha-tubulin suppressor and related RCC1 domain-containing proteins
MNPSKLLSSVLALAIGITPMTASAEQYFYRYKFPVSGLPLIPVDDTEYGIGNDIVAYFVAPVGYDFSKKIPVATKDVVEWVRDTGDIPNGIALNVTSGIIAGQPEQPEQQSTLWHGYDASGNRIARAEMHFTVFQPVGVPSVIDFYTHTGTYFYGEIPNPEGVEVHTWVPVDGVVYPAGMSMMGSALHGTPVEAGQRDLAWRGFDYLGREVAFAYGDILVADGPVVEEVVDGEFRIEFGDQTKDKSRGESFNIQAAVREALGQVTYKLVPETVRPAGLDFPSDRGHVGGIFDEFETSAAFRIEARDSFDGTTGISTPFTLTTLPAVVDLSSLEGAEFRGTVSTNFYRQFAAQNAVEGAKWEIISGALPEGLVLDETKGRITGQPLKKETQTDIVIRVSGPGMVTAEGGPFTIRIQSEALEASTTPLKVRIGKPFETAGVSVTEGASQGFSVTTTTALTSGLTLDPESGVISAPAGVDQAGYHNAFLKVENGPKDRWTSLWQSIEAYNPLNVAYPNITVQRRKTNRQLPEVQDWSIIGKATYSINPTPPEWMNFNPKSGAIYLEPVKESDEGIHGPFTVTISDSTGESKTSDPFTVTVEDRPEIEAVINDRDMQRFVQNVYRLAWGRNAVGGITYSMTNIPSNWPTDTLRFTPDGWLIGRTNDPVGTVYSGIVIKVTDGEGAEKESEPFDLTVLEPSGLRPLYGSLDTTVTWTKDKTFTGTLPTLGNGYGQITYTFDPPIPGVTMTDPSNGSFSGAISATGVTTHNFTVEDDTDRPSASGTLTLDIREPLDASGQGDVLLNRATLFQPQAVPAIDGGIKPFEFALTGILPKGMHYSNGLLWGTPSEDGDFPVTVNVKDASGEKTTASFTIKVGDPLAFEFDYTLGDLYVGESGPSGILAVPNLKNAMPTASSIVWEQPQGLPPGVDFVRGRFVGTPTEAGHYTVVVNATDGEGRKATTTVDLVVTLKGNPTFEPQTFKTRVGSSVIKTLTASNAVAPLTFKPTNPAGLDHGLVLNESAGTITGRFDNEGTYSAGVTVEDSMGRKSSATITFEVVGDLSISSTDATLKQYEAAENTPAVTAVNAVGTMSYALVSGTLPANVSVDTSTGAIVGTSDEAGTWSGLIIEGTDEDGSKSRTGEFTLTVEQRPELTLTAPPALPLKRFSVATFSAQAENAIPPVRFEVTPDLPVGLNLDTDTGSITGSSDEIVPETIYTLRAIDSKGGELGTDVASFTLKVEERDKLDISIGDIPAKRYSDITASVRVAAGTAVGAVSYEISPALPDGLSFANGMISGRPTRTLDPITYTISAADEKGGELGTDTATFTLSVAERDALGIEGPASHEFPQYFAGDVAYAPVAAIDEAAFSINPALPEGLELNASTGVISGTAAAKMAPTQFTLTVEDAYDSFDKTITLSVGDRVPLVISTPEDQKIVLGGDFTLTLAAENVVGEQITWEHVSGTLPAGITFDPETHSFSGTATEYGVVSNVTIRATDAFGGFNEKTFEFTIIQDGTLITLSAEGGKTRMGHGFDIPAPTADNVVGDFWYEAAGLEGTGLVINRKTGKLEGTAAYAFDKDVVVTVEDVTGRTADVTIRLISAPNMTVTAQANVPLVYNYAPDANVSAPVVTNNDGAVVWTYTGALPEGLTVDPATGAFVGKPKQLGSFGPIQLVASDSLPGSASSNSVTISVTMNDDPIELWVEPFTTKVGYEVNTSLPVYDNHLGAVTFFSTDLPAGITLNPQTGVLSGTATELLDRNVNISIRDTDTLRVTSRPLHLKVIPEMQITVPTQVALTALTDITPISPNRQYVVGNAIWEPIDESENKLPEGIVFDTATGSFRGNAKELGDFGPFTVSSVDSLGDRGVSNSFMIRVSPGAYFIRLEEAELPEGVKRIEEYRYDFKPLLTLVGMDVSELTWTLPAESPPGLQLVDGVLSGTPTQSGEFTFTVKAAYRSVSAERTFTINVELPEIELALPASSLPSGMTRQAYEADVSADVSLKNIPKEELVWSSSADVILEDGEVAGLPAGVSLLPSGVISGTPTTSGTYKFGISATWDNTDPEPEHADDSKLYTIVIEGITYRFTHLAAATSTACGVMNGKTSCWGYNGNGLLGNGTTVARSAVPQEVIGLDDVIAISGIDSHFCAIKVGGTVWCWGLGSSGQLGGGSAGSSSNIPVQVVGLPSSAIDVAAGESHSCATLESGEIWCWGSNSFGQLGDGTKISRATPAAVTDLPVAATRVNAGKNHTCAVLSDGSARCWGARNQGNIGDGTSSGQALVPVQPTGLSSGVVSIVSGTAFNCAVMNDGSMKCWGYNNSGQIGDGTTTRVLTPTTIISSGVTKISANTANTCAVKTSGELLCWGLNTSGQTGVDGDGPVLVPTVVSGLNNVTDVVSGYSFTCAIASGKTYCWGNNIYGQVGNGTSGAGNQVRIPTAVGG